MWYNEATIIVASGGACDTPDRINLDWRLIVSSIPHYVYELVDPRDQSIFYVGITIDLYARYKQHMHCDGVNPQKDKRIQEILAAGHLPIMRTIEQASTFAKALVRETYWIHHYLSIGVPVLNQQIPSSVQAQSQKIRKSDARYGRKFTYDQVKEIIVYRHERGIWPSGLSADMCDWYEFFYFTKPKRGETVNSKKYAQHKKSYERGRKWIAEECGIEALGNSIKVVAIRKREAR